MIKVGAESVIINGKLGSSIQGATVNKCANSIKDDLEANSIVLESDNEIIMLISCDLVGLDNEFVNSTRKIIAKKISIPERNIIIICTHTHNGPSLLKTSYTKDVDFEYLDFLKKSLVELALKTMNSRSRVKLGWSKSNIEIGYNRRCCWEDGSHTMYGDTSRADFTGMESGEDDDHYVLCAIDESHMPTVILHSNTCHPVHFYGQDFFSSDFPGASRKFLRETFGNIPVLFLNGAFGDIAPDSQVHKNGVCDMETSMLRIAHLITGETIKQISLMSFYDNIELKHIFKDMEIPVRLPSDEELISAKELLKRVDKGEKITGFEPLFAFGTVELERLFGKDPVDTIPIHIIQIGDMRLVTQPCELFSYFAKEIKRRSPSECTAVIGNADGYAGYCPTVEGIIGGGYSGKPISWCKLEKDAGYKMVDCASALLRKLNNV